MTPLQHHVLALALTAVFSFGLGVFVWLKNPRRWLNQLFAIHSFAIGWWSATEPWSTMLARSEAMGMLWLRIEHVGVFLLPPLVFHLVAVLLELRTTQRIIRLGYLLSALFICGIFSPLVPLLIPRQVARFYAPFWMLPGALYHVFVAFFWMYVGLSLWYLWRGFRGATGARRVQIKYFFVASLLGYLGGGTDFLLVYGIYVPWLSPYALYLVPVYKLVTAYAILQHHFLDIHVAIRRSLVYSILVSVLTVAYFGLVYAVEWLFRTTFGYHSVWLSLTAFALMALFFQPLKIGIQRVVDWFFFHAPHEELVKRVERLEQEVRKGDQMKAVATLAAGLAHEIKNPLAAIKTFTEFLPQKYADPAFREKFTRIVGQELEKIHATVQDLLAFAKPEAMKQESVVLDDVVQETLTLLSNDCLKRQVKTEVQTDSALRVIGDRTKLKQAFLNLCLNSLDAMGDGGCLRVCTYVENSHAILCISDTGCGIPKEHLSRLFDPFFTTKTGGTGLGLSVVQGIVKDHGGRIRIESQPDEGTTVRLELPLAQG